jgi:molybdate transport system substrate-binding protein
MWLVAPLLSLLALAPVQGKVLTVSAAASLTDAMEAIAAEYAASGGEPVRFNFAGSNALARQVASGAPVDLFISADEAQMDVAQSAGAIDPGTRIDLLGNRLAVIIRRPSHALTDARGLAGEDIRRIAIGDPTAVPAGVYAREYLQKVGMWQVLEPKLVPVGNVRAALSAVENGSVDAAIVYETDAALSRQSSIGFVVSGPSAPRIVYPAAIVRASTNRAAAERFLAFLRGRQASAIFARLGFKPLAAAAH